ncbi:putative DNA polymerase [Frankliniella fusca]|uniref:DNA polymerase n=1 Tax=Frankliniella fusca TaxID=407009 RepID=A0AAE1LS15_9NEOP|nr:putative DNA polymerase [Frankliniella fusca]
MSAYVRVKEGDKEVSGDDSSKYMRCPPVVTLRVEEVESQIKDAILGVLNSYERASGEGSQILFGCVEKIELREVQYSPLKGSIEVGQISKFERQNPSIAVSVFGLEGEREIIPLRISKVSDRKYHVRMFLLRTEEDESHYVLIKNMSQFLGHLSKCKRVLYWCDNCLTPTDSEDRRNQHQELCLHHAAQAVRLPSQKDAVMKFTNYGNMERHDFVIYADLESILVPYDTAFPDPSKSSSTKTQVHKAFGLSYIIVGQNREFVKPPVVGHGGDDVFERFLLALKKEEEEIEVIRGVDYPIDMTPESQQKFLQATHCYLCKQKLPREGVVKVRDHNPVIEKNNFRGAACMSPCNLNLKRKRIIPVFIHNSARYDTHFLISALGKLTDCSDVNVVPKAKERYKSFSWGNLRFLDSFNFLSTSLEKLVNDLHDDDFYLLKELFPDAEKQSLLRRKGVYPYSYFQSEEQFLETCIPPKECFTSDLTTEEISEEDYEHALKVFKIFDMKNLYDYHDLYILLDTVLLSCVFEAFRRLAIKNYHLDPAFYFSLPGLSWDAALLYTGFKLELITDMKTHLMWEKSMRGGVATINERLMECNNPYVSGYDPSKESVYLLYSDANNLYGYSLSRKLPTHGFRFLSTEEIECLDISKLSENDSTVLYIEKNGLPKHSTKNLIPTLESKNKYCVYSTTLKLYVSLGLEIVEVHRVMEFQQEAWLAPYIKFNTEMRKSAISNFQRSQYKLFNNVIFGKSIENVRRRRNVYLTKNNNKFLKHVKSPLFHSFEIFDNGLVAIEKRKSCILLNRPIFSGSVCLDLAKELMYDFYYNVLKAYYGDRVTCGASDTDSLILSRKTNDVYQDMLDYMEHLDTSDYPQDHFLYSSVNKKVIGKFKDELNGTPLRAMA